MSVWKESEYIMHIGMNAKMEYDQDTDNYEKISGYALHCGIRSTFNEKSLSNLLIGEENKISDSKAMFALTSMFYLGFIWQNVEEAQHYGKRCIQY